MASEHTIAIIPARGGSKAIPRKNIVDLGGVPLIAWPIKIAKQIPQIDRIIVSTDDEEIAEVARLYGAETIKRPSRLAADKTPTLPVLQHVVSHLLEREKYKTDNVILLYATSPFLRPDRIKAGLKLLTHAGCNSVVGVQEIKGRIWAYATRSRSFLPKHPSKSLNRQYFVPWLHEAGNIYLTKASVLMKQNRLIDPKHCKFVHIGDDECLDIDHYSDLQEARKRLRSNVAHYWLSFLTNNLKQVLAH